MGQTAIWYLSRRDFVLSAKLHKHLVYIARPSHVEREKETGNERKLSQSSEGQRPKFKSSTLQILLNFFFCRISRNRSSCQRVLTENGERKGSLWEETFENPITEMTWCAGVEFCMGRCTHSARPGAGAGVVQDTSAGSTGWRI
jgi:hypothetical protein